MDGEVKAEAVVMQTDVTASHTTDDETVDENGKRKAHLSGDNKERKKRFKTASSLSDLDKNPCMLLNEKCHDVTYDVLSQVGPIHMPVFTVQATVGDQVSQSCVLIVLHWLNWLIPVACHVTVFKCNLLILLISSTACLSVSGIL